MMVHIGREEQEKTEQKRKSLNRNSRDILRDHLAWEEKIKARKKRIVDRGK